MKQLWWMAEEKDRSEWDRFASLITATINSNPYRETPVKVHQIHPYMNSHPSSEEGIDPALEGQLKNRTHQKWSGEL